MTQPVLNQRLTSVDASFLYYERKESPLHIGSVNIFDDHVPFEEFVAHINSKMPLLPRYRQKVVPVPYNLGHPIWEFDPTFDIRRHVLPLELPAPGTLDQLRELTEKVQSTMLDRSKPLWELYLVQGVDGYRSAMIAKVHHAMVDGVSGVDLMKVLLDISPAPPPSPPPDLTPHPPAPDPTRLMIDGMLESAHDGMKSWLDFQTNLLNLAQTWLREPQVPSSGSLLASLGAPPSLLSFNRASSGQTRLAWSSYSFAEARAIRAALGGTVNDVVLTALSGAIIKYLTTHGQPTKGRSLRVMVPVSMRREDQRGALGNLVSVLPVEIPLDLPDHQARYTFLNNRTGALKGARVAEGINVFTALMGTVPAQLQALIGSLATTPVPPFNIVSTNVPGPQIPLYVLGRRVIASYPFVPVGFAIGVACAIFSYDQKLSFGITADANAMPDVAKLKEALDETFEELKIIAGVPSGQTQVAPPAFKAPRRKTKIEV